MSRQMLAAEVQKQAQNEVKKQQAYFQKEALTCIKETNETLKALASGNLKKAKEQVQKAKMNAKKVMTKLPDIQYVLVNISVSSSDFISTIEQVDKLQSETKKAINKGLYQKASDLLGQMKSEIDITTVNMFFSIYPEKLEQVDSLLRRKKVSDAENILYGLLNSLEIKQIVLPLPVLRAEALVDQAAKSSKTNNNVAVNLLKNADYQLQLADAMGYGNYDKEYLSLSKQIRNTIKNSQAGRGAQKTYLALHNNLQQFKSRVFYKSKDIR